MGQCKSLLKQIEGDKILDLLLNEKPAAVTASNGSYKKDSISAVYPALPSKYKSVHCVKVYDWDTLTLDSGDRVRLIGIDAPEIKENQPYAQEAKMFVSVYVKRRMYTFHLNLVKMKQIDVVEVLHGYGWNKTMDFSMSMKQWLQMD